MFIDDLENILDYSKGSNFSIFVTHSAADFKTHFPAKNTLFIEPENGKISIEQVRGIINFCRTKQKSDFFVAILQAEKINEQAENALLKILEEPADNYHFALQVSDSSALLPTILSRGNLYIERIKNTLSAPLIADEIQKLYAKRIISARISDLPQLAQSISAEKDYKKDPRGFTLSVVDLAIEIAYKSFFKTKNPLFLKKLTQLLKLQANLKQNGHIKLHLVADLC